MCSQGLRACVEAPARVGFGASTPLWDAGVSIVEEGLRFWLNGVSVLVTVALEARGVMRSGAEVEAESRSGVGCCPMHPSSGTPLLLLFIAALYYCSLLLLFKN